MYCFHFTNYLSGGAQQHRGCKMEQAATAGSRRLLGLVQGQDCLVYHELEEEGGATRDFEKQGKRDVL